MLAVVELSEYLDGMTVFCVSCKICRNNNASNWRETSPTFCCSVSVRLCASCSIGTSAAELFWSGEIFTGPPRASL